MGPMIAVDGDRDGAGRKLARDLNPREVEVALCLWGVGYGFEAGDRIASQFVLTDAADQRHVVAQTGAPSREVRRGSAEARAGGQQVPEQLADPDNRR